MKLKCEKCGILDFALFDGYRIGDRLLEGVMFVVKAVKAPTGDYLHTDGVQKSDEDYFSGFNKERFVNAVNESLVDIVEQYDMDLECPKNSRHEVDLVDDGGVSLSQVIDGEIVALDTIGDMMDQNR